MRTWYKSYLFMCAGASDILAARCMASETNSFTADHVSAMRYSQPKLLKRYHELNSSVAQFKLWRFHCLLNLQLQNSLSFRCNTFWCSDVTDCENKAWRSANRLAREVETVLVANGVKVTELHPAKRQRTTEEWSCPYRRMNAQIFNEWVPKCVDATLFAVSNKSEADRHCVDFQLSAN